MTKLLSHILKAPVEDPERLRDFQRATANLNWTGDHGVALNRLFQAVNDLIQAEIVYYYRQRKRRRSYSTISRAIAILAGTAGVLLPLIAVAAPTVVNGSFGYPFLVLSGAALAVNRLFDSSSGHIRFVTAQLDLERELTKFRIDWEHLKSRIEGGQWLKRQSDEAFSLLRHFTDAAYLILTNETNDWGSVLVEAIKEYAQQVGSAQKANRRLPGAGRAPVGRTRKRGIPPIAEPV
jgi:hypothetical protein